MMLVGAVCMGLAGVACSALGQTNLDGDLLQTEPLRDLSPIAQVLRLALCFLGAVLLVIAAVLTMLRQRVVSSSDEALPDEHWTEDAEADAGQRFAASEVIEACEALQQPVETGVTEEAATEASPPPQGRLFTPASGPAWGEAMLKAFLMTCLKVNCLGRTWRESEAGRRQSAHLPDPREAELIRRFMQRWQEFHVDPEAGVFLDRASSTGKTRVCVIGVSKARMTVVEAAFNAGFVIESVGRYLKSTDLVYRRGAAEYHAPTKDELAAMTPGERESLVRITEITDSWQAMIAGPKGVLRRASTSPAPGQREN